MYARVSTQMGWLPYDVGDLDYGVLDVGNGWAAIAFVPRVSKTIQDVSVYIYDQIGTLGSSDARLDIYDTVADGSDYDQPGSSLGYTTTVTGLTIDTWATWSGLNVAVEAGKAYFLVFKNLNGSPGSNLYYLKTLTSENIPQIGNFGAHSASSYDSGSSWAHEYNRTPCVALFKYSDNSYDGFPVEYVEYTDNYGFEIYDNRLAGTKFTSPANARINILAISFWILYWNLPSGELVYKLYDGDTLLGTTRPCQDIYTDYYGITLEFENPITVEPGTTLRVVFGETTNSDTDPTFYSKLLAFQDSAEAAPLHPLGGVGTYFDGSSWTDYDEVFVPFSLKLDYEGEFAAQSGGGGLMWPERGNL